MIYDNPYDLIDKVNPSALSVLTDDARDILRYCMDFSGLVLVLLTDTVKTMDSINGDVLASDTIGDFISYSINYAMEEA